MNVKKNKIFEDITKLKLESLPPSDGVKIVDLYQKIENGLLDLSPDFQRKLVWKEKHKFNFIKTILINFPFPEIYIASEDINVEEKTAREIVVDGKQRLTTICNYINAEDVFADAASFPSFADLDTSMKKAFLNYKVTVRDLKDVAESNVNEIFRRINSTEYPLNKIELLNSEYGDSEFVCFVKQLADEEKDINFDSVDYVIEKDFCKNLQTKIYKEWGIFPNRDRDRMFVLMFFMNVTVSIIEEKYHGRNLAYQEYVEKFNDIFPMADDVYLKLKESLERISILSLATGSFIYSKTMLFTLLVEFSFVDFSQIDMNKLKKQFEILEEKYGKFAKAELGELSPKEINFFEYNRNSMNEKKARELRGEIIKEILDISKK